MYTWRTNWPYLSGDSFAKIVDYVPYGRFGRRRVSLRKLKSAKSIFVAGHLLEKFLDENWSSVMAKVLIVGNSDQNWNSLLDLPSSIELYLCQNFASDTNSKVKTLPIGLENIRLGRTGRKKYHRQNLNLDKKCKVLIPPMSPTNAVRQEILYISKNLDSNFEVFTSLLSEKEYFKLVKQFKFVLCCEGNGYDTHRVWETLYQGSFPVLLRTAWSETLREYALPILIVEDLKQIDTKLLEDFAKRNAGFNPALKEVLWMPYWDKLIAQFTGNDH